MVGHLGGNDFVLVCLGDLVVKDLVDKDDALLLYTRQSAASGKDHLALGLVLHWLDPDAVAVNAVLYSVQ